MSILTNPNTGETWDEPKRFPLKLDSIIARVPALTRISDSDGWRWYSHGDELTSSDMYAGVTGILECAVDQKLKTYFVKNSANKQTKRLIETGDIGTEIHNLIEQDLNGHTVAITNPETKEPFERWLECKAKHKIKAYRTETMVLSRKYGFAGTFDIYGEIDGKPSVMDIKTGWLGVKAGWQIAAYRLAALEMGLVDTDCGMAAINIKRDGSVGQPFVYEHIDWCTKSFLSCFEVWKALYFGKLNKLEWPWLKVSSLAALKGTQYAV